MTPLFSSPLEVRPTATLYREAASLIERNGRAIGAYAQTQEGASTWREADEHCKFCMMGALLFVAVGVTNHAFTAEHRVIDGKVFKNTDEMIDFSDRAATNDEVIAKLREIAATLED